MTAAPTATAVTSPELETVATVRSELAHFTSCPVMMFPAVLRSVASSCAVAETLIATKSGARTTDATGLVASVTGALSQLVPLDKTAMAVIAAIAGLRRRE